MWTAIKWGIGLVIGYYVAHLLFWITLAILYTAATP